MYFPPKEYDCPKCNSNLMWSQNHDMFGLGVPFCIFCYKEFMKNNIPIMLEKINERMLVVSHRV